MQAVQLVARSFWETFAPNFHIADTAFLGNIEAFSLQPATADILSRQLIHEGYFHVKGVDWKLDLKSMAELTRNLSRAGISPVFALMYDEFWLLFYKLHKLYQSLLGGDYVMLPDFWVWDVNPAKGESGWRPHRDKGRVSLFADGSPKSITTWIPISKATPLNGCMYVVPAHLDKSYNTESENSREIDFPSIRALPADPGDFFVWNQAVLHWGGRSSPRGEESRVSIAFEFQRRDVALFNGPAIPPLTLLDYNERLRLIAKQILQYRHMYSVDPAIEELSRRVLNSK